MDGFQNATVCVIECVFSRLMSKHCHITFSVGLLRVEMCIVQALVFVRLRPLDLVVGPSPPAVRLLTPDDDEPFITWPPVLLLLLSVLILRLTLLLVLSLRLSKKTLNLLLLLPLLRWR